MDFLSYGVFYYLRQSQCVVLGMSEKLTGMSLSKLFFYINRTNIA